MPDPVHRATERLGEADLPALVLGPSELPEELGPMAVEGENVLDNDDLIANLFPELSPHTLRHDLGRLSGYVRRFAAVEAGPPAEGAIVAVGATSHLYETPDNVARWVTEIFPGRFESKVGQSLAGRFLHRCDRFSPRGLSDLTQGMEIMGEASGIMTTQVIIDFRVGRVLGVVFVHASGDVARRAQAEQLAKAQEAKIVRISLGAEAS